MISKIRNNKTQSINLQVLSDLCGYLMITPGELFSHNDLDFILQMTDIQVKVNYEQIDATHDLLSVTKLHGFLDVEIIELIYTMLKINFFVRFN